MRVTVVPEDRVILVDGEPLVLTFSAPANLRALQWLGTSGHLEFIDGRPNQSLAEDDYSEHVAPFVQAWKAEKLRLTERAAKEEAMRLAEYNSEDARFERLRAERDSRIAATDYLMTSDYPLTDAQRAAVTAYRQALRDLPAQEGAPWDGGGEETPWPPYPQLDEI